MEPEEWREQVGKQLEAARKAAGINSMRAAAKEAGFSEGVWRYLESGRRSLTTDVVVAPHPEVETLWAAALAVGLDPVQLVADAGYGADEIAMAEDMEAARLRSPDVRLQVVEEHVEDGRVVGVVARPAAIVQVERELDAVVGDLSFRGKVRVLTFARGIQGEELADVDLEDETDALSSMPSVEAMDLAIAAHQGSLDPHDDQVGTPTTRHPGGSDTEPVSGG